ncbi:SMP-30/gluconolactonase/LRE family protein [Pontiella sulfatireligans]|uniref:SMP-30/Gluconolactonase/LRE-like region domain-containing protein n=1 Tax=Pontiella sulfatireligans TaxID=2750658 RepID=A0A6C2UW10_9BACT|nr:hypothetical protein [Pontiella sulfatireligans]VGO23374.1 hypothetical protein SCARR_05481 [Pontiella sulfatireligans]
MKIYQVVASLAVVAMLGGCTTPKKECSGVCKLGGELLKPAAPIVLPNEWNSPDGMTVGKDGNIYLSINNVGDQSYPAKIGIIDANDKVSVFSDLPPHPETGKVSPLGIVFGSDGNLYVADNQTFVTDKPGLSRLLRINIKNGKAAGVDVVATGLQMANGVTAFGGFIAVNDTSIDTTYPLTSGTYRFSIEELAKGPVQVKGLGDPHLIATLKTMNKKHQVGANGAAYSKSGELFVCNFGDAEIWKAAFNKDGSVESWKLFSKGEGLDSVDGLQIDQYGKLWTADFLGNAIACICPKSGAVKVVAKNEPGDGKGGAMDAPSECIRRGNKVYVANIDLTYGSNTSDEIHTISVFVLP